jgi:hypothetical protein
MKQKNDPQLNRAISPNMPLPHNSVGVCRHHPASVRSSSWKSPQWPRKWLCCRTPKRSSNMLCELFVSESFLAWLSTSCECNIDTPVSISEWAVSTLCSGQLQSHLPTHDSCYNMAAECLTWTAAMSHTEHEDPTPTALITTPNAYFAADYFLKTNMRSSGSSEHIRKCEVTATALGNYTMHHTGVSCWHNVQQKGHTQSRLAKV